MTLSRSLRLIRRSHSELGTTRFLLVNLALFGWIALFFTLAIAVEWPAGCGIDGIVQTYRCTVPLAATGSPAAIALAAWLWATPLLVILFIVRRARRPRADQAR